MRKVLQYTISRMRKVTRKKVGDSDWVAINAGAKTNWIGNHHLSIFNRWLSNAAMSPHKNANESGDNGYPVLRMMNCTVTARTTAAICRRRVGVTYGAMY